MAKIQDGTFKIVHVIKLNEYQNFLNEIQIFINNSLPKDSIFFPSITHEVNQLSEMLNSIYPLEKSKQKRSINMLGTAWKFIAGSPDHDDLQIIENNLNSLNKNNDKQVVINEMLSDRMNNLTIIVNKLNKVIGKTDSISNTVAISIQVKLRIVKEDLQNIKYAIQWAKNNIINSILLNKKEVHLALDMLNKEKIEYSSVEEALEFAKVKILYYNSTLLYVIYIPLTSEKTYNRIIIRPVKRNNKIIKTIYKEIIKYEEEIYGIKEHCRNINSFDVCNKNQINNISNSTCIPFVLKGLNSSCDMSYDYHIPEIEQLDTGLILLNGFKGSLNKMYFEGTYLIAFFNETIEINNKVYKNLETTQIEATPQIIQPAPLEKEFVKLLSLEMLSKLHLNNTEKIELLKTDAIINKSLLLIIFLIFLGCLIIFKFFFKSKEHIIFHPTSQKLKPAEKEIDEPVLHHHHPISPTTYHIFNV